MKIEFDPEKDRANLIKHGVPLSAADQLDWNRMIVGPDTRRDYGEYREIGYAPFGDRLYCIVFVRRDDVIRPISLRKANDREVGRYEKG